MPIGFWTDERVEDLKSTWLTGECSASEIAVRFGVSRNAILGKVFRLGLSEKKASRRYLGEPRARSIFHSHERMPAKPREHAPPKVITTVSAVTGAIIRTGRRPPPIREMTKTELRAMLTQAVINTGGVV